MFFSLSGKTVGLCLCIALLGCLLPRQSRAQDATSGTLAANYRSKPIPSGKDAPTSAQFHARMSAWLEKFTLDRFAQTGNHDPSWDQQARDFIRNAIRLRSTPTAVPVPNDLKEAGDKIFAAGCREPYFLFWHNVLKLRSTDYQDRTKFLADDELAKASRLYEYFQIVQFTPSQFDAPEPGQAAMRALAAAVATGEIGEDAVEFVPAWLSLMDGPSLADWQLFLGELRKKNKPLDPWLDAYFEGKYAVRQAWEARGSGYADSVTDQGWEGFGKHLSHAREMLTKAYRLHPDRPEPAAAMIEVAMGMPASSKETRYWFDQAVAAQMDHLPAYHALLWSLRPRWRGSHIEMLLFGQEAAATGRFDTLVPLMFLDSLTDVGSEAPGGTYRLVFRTPGMAEKITRVLDGYSSSSIAAEYGDLWKYQRAVFECAMGNYDNALDTIDHAALKPLTLKAVLTRSSNRGGRYWSVVKTECDMFTGKFADQMRQAEEHELNWRSDLAITIYKNVMDAQDDPVNKRYVRDRIAIIMLAPRGKDYTFREGYALLQAAKKLGAADVDQFLTENGGDTWVSRETQDNLLEAVVAGDIKRVAKLLDQGKSPDADPRADWTPLFMAINQKQEAIANLLIDRGANVNARLNDGTTLLMTAISINNVDLAKKLIAAGADVNAANDQGVNPLHHAVSQKHVQLVNLLLDSGADPNLPTKDGWLPLHWAFPSKHKETIQALLAHGANPAQPGRQPPPSVYVAAEDDEIDSLIMEAARKNTPQTKGAGSAKRERNFINGPRPAGGYVAPLATSETQSGAPVTPP